MPSRDKYTDPDLRDEVKEEVHASDKGGRPGQWSARKVPPSFTPFTNTPPNYKETTC